LMCGATSTMVAGLIGLREHVYGSSSAPPTAHTQM
jgi:hypothetical protein